MFKLKNTKKKGFNLMETIVVIAMISILSGIGMYGYNAYVLKKKNTQAIADLMKVKSALENYYAQNGRYPSSEYGGAVWHGYCYFGNNSGPGYGLDWIPELKNPYFPDGMPIEPNSKMAGSCVDDTRQYIYFSNAFDYKLIYLNPESMGVPNNLIDPVRTTSAYGFWTEGLKGF
jgi:prepilin-type N-terminal cleavage/methylation domain-containing protein